MSEYGNIYEILGSKIVRKFSVGDYVPPEPEPSEEGEEMFVNAVYSEVDGGYTVTLDKTFAEIKNAVSGKQIVYVYYENDAVDGNHEILGKEYQVYQVGMVSDGYKNPETYEYEKTVLLNGALYPISGVDYGSIYAFMCSSDSDYPAYSTVAEGGVG